MQYGVVNLVVRELYTRSEAAEVLSISERTLYDLEQDGEIDVVRIGRAVRITRESILRYIESLSEEAERERRDQRLIEYVRRESTKLINKYEEKKRNNPELADECDKIIESFKPHLEWAQNGGK